MEEMEAWHSSNLLVFFVLGEADETFVPLGVLLCIRHLPGQLAFRNVSDGKCVQNSLGSGLALTTHVVEARGREYLYSFVTVALERHTVDDVSVGLSLLPVEHLP